MAIHQVYVFPLSYVVLGVLFPPRMFTKTSFLFAATISCSTFLANTQAVPAWELDHASVRTNGSWAFGDRFTVGSQDISVDKLGAFDSGGDGFVTAGGIAVGLYTSGGTLLASTYVQSNDTLVDFYRFSSINPVLLTAGMSYLVVAVSGSDLYNFSTTSGNLTVDPRITWNGYQYASSTTLTTAVQGSGTDIAWFANFNIADTTTTNATSVPDGGTTLVLLGISFGSAAWFRRKVTAKA
jgi:hypothetical protein